MNRQGFFGLALILLLLSSCAAVAPESGSVTRDGDIVSGTGTVKRVELEGGFFAIVGDDKVTYDPINLASGFQVDGMRVRFRARIRNDLASIRMVGPQIEILEISRM